MEIIKNCQTPKVSEVLRSEIDEYISNHKAVLLELLEFTKNYKSDKKVPFALAANQMNNKGKRLNIRAFVTVDVKTGKWSIIIDPLITKFIGAKDLKHEECMTWDVMKVEVERNYYIRVNYYDIEGKLHENELKDGLNAQIWQHELDHLNGVNENLVPYFKKLPVKIKTGRNDMCSCGSKKKYKNCCLTKKQ